MSKAHAPGQQVDLANSMTIAKQAASRITWSANICSEQKVLWIPHLMWFHCN